MPSIASSRSSILTNSRGSNIFHCLSRIASSSFRADFETSSVREDIRDFILFISSVRFWTSVFREVIFDMFFSWDSIRFCPIRSKRSFESFWDSSRSLSLRANSYDTSGVSKLGILLFFCLQDTCFGTVVNCKSKVSCDLPFYKG